MAWIRMSGGTDSKLSLFPPKTGWTTSGSGNFTLADNSMSVINIPVNGQANFTIPITPKAVNRNFKITVQSDSDINLRYLYNNVDTSLGSGTPRTPTEYSFVIPANQSSLTLIFKESWSSSVGTRKSILSVTEV